MQNRLTTAEVRKRKSRTIFDLGYLKELFQENWKWFALSVVCCLLIAGAYIYFSRPSYNILGKMMLIERKSSNVNVSQMMNQLPFNLGSNLGIGRSIGSENEKEILHSTLMSKDVVEELGLYTEYRLQKVLKSRLIYKSQPINVTVSPETLQQMSDALPLTLYKINLTIDKTDAGYTIKGKILRNSKKLEIKEQTFKEMPAVVQTELGNLTLNTNNTLDKHQAKTYEKDYTLNVQILPPMTVAKQFVKRLSINSASKKATYIFHLNLQDESIPRGIDFVNQLVAHYNQRTNEEKHEEIERSDNYVNERLAKIDTELGAQDENWERSRKQFQITDPKVDAEEVIGKKSDYESQLVNIGIQLQLLDYLKEYVTTPANLYELIPVNVGVYSGDAVSMISQHNNQVNERKLLMKSVSEKSPQLQQLSQLIEELHPVILTALERDRQSILIKRKTIEQEYNRYMARVGDVPQQERVLTEIGRDRNIKQGVYVALLQKREENAMELISSTDKGRLIDETQYTKKVKPRLAITGGLAIILGFVIPFVVLFLRRQLSKRIGKYDDLLAQTDLPVIGRIAQGARDYSVVRTNLLHQMQEGKKRLIVTSASTGDGVSTVVKGLEQSLSQTGRRVAVMDLSTASADTLVSKTLQDRINQLQNEYDCVIIDFPAINEHPEALVDGLADITCYVCRPMHTKKVAIEQLERWNEENRIANPCIIAVEH